MPKIVTPLTLAQVKAARAKDKIYKLPDGVGLLFGYCHRGGNHGECNVDMTASLIL